MPCSSGEARTEPHCARPRVSDSSLLSRVSGQPVSGGPSRLDSPLNYTQLTINENP